MTISTTTNFSRVLGDGANTVFNFNFIADQASDISVTYYVGSTQVSVINTSLYTLFINPPAIGQIWGIGGTVIYPLSGSPIANGTSLLIQRTLPLTQTISIANQGPFSPEVIEEALDTLEMQIQQVAAIGSQSVVSQLGYTPMNGANNLSEITSAATARTNLALGSMAIQNASSVSITGGTINGVAITGSSYAGTIDNTIIGGTTPAAGNFSSFANIGSFAQSGGDAIFDLSSGNHAFTVDTSGGSGAINLSSGSGNIAITSVSGSYTGGAKSLLFFSDNASLSLTQAGQMQTNAPVVFTAASSGVTLKRGANGRTGTLVLTGTTAVTVSNTVIATSDVVSFSLNTVGGTVGANPSIKSISPGTSFTAAGTALDVSTYNYVITKSSI